MAQLIGSLFVSLTADFAPFQRNMKSAEGVVASTTSGMRRNIGLTEKSVASFHRQTSSQIKPYALISASRAFDTVQQRANLLRGALFATTAAFGGLGAALTTNVVSRYIDSFTGLENQMRVVSTSSADLAANMSEVQAVAERSRSSLQAVGTLFTRIAKAAPEQGVAAILRRVETVNKALQLGGATAQEAASAAIQFSQAIASNRLGGEELRAVLETPLGNELAKGLGVTIGEFRKMGTEGKLTADVLFKALDKIAGGINEKFAKSVSTIDQALTVADGKITMYAGSLDDAYGITKLMTGAIGSFGDNLETIVPLLAVVGAGLGSIFGGRLIGGSVGRSYASIAGGIKAVTQARADNLRVEKEAFAVAQRTAAAAKSSVNAAQVNAFGPSALSAAPKEDQKAYLRDAAALAKLESARAGATKAVMEQQAKVAASLRQQRILTSDLAKANNLAASIRNSRPTRDGDAERLAAAERTVVTAQQAQVAAISTASAEQQKLVALKRTEAEITSRVSTQRGKVDVSGAAVLASGAKASADALEETARASANAENAILRTQASMRAAGQAASLAATGFAVLRTGAASLVGFLGGPWGVAFTTAIGLLAYFGAQTRATAEEIARAQDIIDEVTSGAGGQGVVTVNERIALSQKKIIAETERLNLVTKEAARQRQDYADAAEVASLAIMDDDGKRRAAEIIQQFRDGKASIADFNKELKAVGVDTDAIGQLGLDLIKTENLAELATLAIKRLSASIADMKKALGAVDFAKDVRPDDLVARDAPRYQRSLYGRGQEVARVAADEARRRRELLDAAGDTGDSARNTPAKIAAREQELLEQGYVRTREAARTLATEELNLAESQRLANKQIKDGTKEATTFANKLKELQEQGSGAFLSELDRKVLDVAKSLKDGSAMMAQYIAAIKSGDMSQAPPELLQARDALMQIGAADTWRGIIDKYGQGAQLAGQFADKQMELNYLVQSGHITAQQSEQAWADFIGQFKEYEWIDQTADAFANFADAAITDFRNIGDAFKALVKDLAKIALQAAVLDPFKAWIRGSLSSAVGGGATNGGNIASGIAQQAAAALTGGANDNYLPSAVTRSPIKAVGASGDIAGYIRQAAIARGIDPEIALRVAKSEGGLKDPFRQGEAMLSYGREESYGPFQLHMRQGGVGARALKAGIDPRTNWKGGVDFGLDEAANKGWGQWFGAAKAGIGNREGLDGAQAIGQFTKATKEATTVVQGFDTGMTGALKAVTGGGVNGGGLGGLFGLGLSNFGSGFNPTKTGLMDMLGGGGSSSSGGGSGIFGMLLGFLPKLFGFASGGWIGGAGGGRSDSNLIRASKGEFVVNSAAANRHGALLEAINAGRVSPGGNSASFMDAANQNVSSMARRNAGNGAPKVDININLDGAQGNEEVRRIARSAVAEGLGAFQAQQVRGGVAQNQKRFQSEKG